MLALVLGGARSGKSEAAERLVAKHLAAKDLVAKDLVAKEPTAKDLVAKEPTAKDLAAKDLVAKIGRRVVYLAPGQAWDQEMAERIARHRERRDPAWLTVEEPLQIPEAIRRHGKPGLCFLLDGLGTWVSNLLLAECSDADIMIQVQDLLSALAETGADAVAVSDETGLGVIPALPLGRLFRDTLGRANQMVAASADRVLLVVAGIPVDLKALEASL